MKTQLTAIIIFLFTFSVNVRAQFSQQGSKLVNSALAVDGRQGTSVDISADGNTAIVGVPYDGITGGALIYVRNNGSWIQQGAKLFGTGYKIGRNATLSQGSAVAISGDGNTVAIGDPNDNDYLGAVYVFTRSNGVWTQQGSKLTASGLTGVSGQGNSVDLSYDGNTLVIGAPLIYVGNASYKGGAFVFIRTGASWVQQSNNLFSGTSAPQPHEGYAVAVSGDGNTLVVGAPGRNYSSNDGGVHFYARSGSIWSLTNSISGDVNLGAAVALNHDGTVAAIGAPDASSSNGSVEIYTLRGIWRYSTTLAGSNAGGKFNQGESVSISADGNIIAFGGGGNWQSKTFGLGQAWVFNKSGNVWIQDAQKYQGNSAVGNAGQGISIALSADGKTFIIGGAADDNDKGAAWVFNKQTGASSTFNTEKSLNQICVFPNPATTELNIDFGTNNIEPTIISIIDQLGKTVVSTTIDSGLSSYSQNIEELADGLYFISIRKKFGEVKWVKFLKN